MAVGAWVAATTVGVVVAWIGLRPVLNAAVPDRATALPAADLRHLTPAAPQSVPAVSPAVPPASSAQPPASPTKPASFSAAPSAVAATTTGAATSPAASPSTSVVDGWTVTTQPNGSQTFLRTFEVPGGTAVVRMVPGKVSLVSATPKADYSVQTSQPDPTRLVIQFVATNRYDIVDAMWWNGHPYVQVSRVG